MYDIKLKLVNIIFYMNLLILLCLMYQAADGMQIPKQLATINVNCNIIARNEQFSDVSCTE